MNTEQKEYKNIKYLCTLTVVTDKELPEEDLLVMADRIAETAAKNWNSYLSSDPDIRDKFGLKRIGYSGIPITIMPESETNI